MLGSSLELWLEYHQKRVLREYELFELCRPTSPPQRGCLRRMSTQSKAPPREMSCEHRMQLHLDLSLWTSGYGSNKLQALLIPVWVESLSLILKARNDLIFIYLLGLSFCFQKRTLCRLSLTFMVWSTSIHLVFSQFLHRLFILIASLLSLLWFHILYLQAFSFLLT